MKIEVLKKGTTKLKPSSPCPWLVENPEPTRK